MNKKLSLITGIGLGAGLMYIFDPDRGKCRRTLVHDKVANTVNQTGFAIKKRTYAVQSRIHGFLEGLKYSFTKVTDDVLVGRVRSKIEGAVSNPKLIEITAENGIVTLSGSIPAVEVGALLRCVSSVHGVRKVENLLEAHKRATDMIGPLLVEAAS